MKEGILLFSFRLPSPTDTASECFSSGLSDCRGRPGGGGGGGEGEFSKVCVCEVAAIRDNWHHEAHYVQHPSPVPKPVFGRPIFRPCSGPVFTDGTTSVGEGKPKLDLDRVRMVHSQECADFKT